MIDRGWISNQRLLKAISIKQAIKRLEAPEAYKDVLHLALVTEVVSTASNVRFGPELDCGQQRKRINLLTNFGQRVRLMSRDLGIVRDMAGATARVISGDARFCSGQPRGREWQGVVERSDGYRR